MFTTEIAQKEEIIGQDRVVQTASGPIGGKISAVSFNQVAMDVTFGDPSRLLRRGEIAINTIAATKALTHQSQALDAVVFDRAVSPRLKAVILNPGISGAAVPVVGVTVTDKDFDKEKADILAKALGVQDVLAIVGPPGTGKTKLITEIVVQWLLRNPEHRILLSSQTHIALDNVLRRSRPGIPVEMIRIGRTDDPKISDQSKKLLLERRVEAWIAEVRAAAEAEMIGGPTRTGSTERWSRSACGSSASSGSEAERDIQDSIVQMKIEREDVEAEGQDE